MKNARQDEPQLPPLRAATGELSQLQVPADDAVLAPPPTR
jgi:hypothetical protein